MNCPACGRDADRVTKSGSVGTSVIRWRSCGACQATWRTRERVEPGSLSRPLVDAHAGPDMAHGNLSGSALSLLPLEADPDPSKLQYPDPRARGKRGKSREYSDDFEACWKAYGRGENKTRAGAAWDALLSEGASSEQLREQILSALEWQSKLWAPEGWKYAPHFERYLKNRRWTDRQPPAPLARNAKTSGNLGVIADWDRSRREIAR